MNSKVVLSTAWAAACLGAIAGAAPGHAAGWILVQAAFVALLVPMAHDSANARAASGRVAAFVAGWALAGLMPFATGVPAPLARLVWLPVGLIAAAHAAVLGALTAAVWKFAASTSLRLLLGLPAAWVIDEWLFGVGPWAVPWARLGDAVAPDGPWAGVLPWGGSLMAGALVVAGAGALAIAAQRRAIAASRWPLAAATTMLALGLLGGSVRWTEPSGTLPVTLAQPGMEAAPGDEASLRAALAFYRDAARDVPAGLLVMPELALPKTAAALPAGFLAQLRDELAARDADALIGLYAPPDEADRTGYHNAAYALGVSGVQRYLKSRLIPFGESNPLGDALRARIAAWRGTRHGLTLAGAVDDEPLRVAGHRVAPALCYEAAFADDLRRRASMADLLVVMSGDSALDAPALVRQAERVARTRALELQKPLLRVSDTEGTLVVDATGRVQGRATAHLPVRLHASVVTMTGLTPYARFGDALALCAALLALGIAALPTARGVSEQVPRRRMPPACAGQVLPAAVGLLLVVAGVFYLMVNSGQAVTEKIRVTNAADAAAYSAGIVEARALNYDAYTNRAMVANEIAIAQMVSLASWLDYFATGADNYGANLTQVNLFVLPDPKVLVLDAAFLGTNYISAYTGMTAQEYADYIIEYGLAPIITLHNGVAEALSLSQKAVRLNLTAGVRQQQIANDVVKAMDPGLSAEVVPVTHGFDLFTKNYARSGGSGDERGRLADVVMRSRDPFTRERNWTANGMDIPFVKKDGALKKRGGTELIGYDEWRAVDTLELHGRVFGCGKYGLSWCDDIQSPVGWGATEVDAGGGDAGRGYHGNAYGENGNTANRAEDNMRRPTYAYFTGIPDSMELRNLDPKADITSGVTVRVEKSQAALLTSGGAAQNKPSGDLRLFDDKPAAGRMAALSRAQVYFDRIAARADGKEEIGSLYNPYWRVRLVAPTAADKAYAAARQGGMGMP